MTDAADPVEAAYREWSEEHWPEIGTTSAFRAGWTAALASRPAPTQSPPDGPTRTYPAPSGYEQGKGAPLCDASAPNDLREAVAGIVRDAMRTQMERPPFPPAVESAVAAILDLPGIAPRAVTEGDVERVARAIADDQWEGSQPWDYKPTTFRDRYRATARAALAALQEPKP